MFNLSEPRHFRKMVAGLCMVLSPLFLLASVIVHPRSEPEAGAQLAVVAANQGAWYAAHLLALIALVLAIPAVLGFMHMLRERQVAYGHVGGALALLGIVAWTGLMALELVVWQMVKGDADPAQMASLLERVTEATGIFVPLFVMGIALALGLIVLAAGLYRARAVPTWSAALLAIGIVVLYVGGALFMSEALAIIGAAILLVGEGAIGMLVLGETDAEWEHTPRSPSFRPLAGAR
jgi:hypothetical protein